MSERDSQSMKPYILKSWSFERPSWQLRLKAGWEPYLKWGVCRFFIHPFIWQMFMVTHSLPVTVVGSGHTTMNKADNASALRGYVLAGWQKQYTQKETSLRYMGYKEEKIRSYDGQGFERTFFRLSLRKGSWGVDTEVRACCYNKKEGPYGNLDENENIPGRRDW